MQARQVIQFPEAGTFTVRSASAAHRAVLHVTVAGESGCGTPKPTLTLAGGKTTARLDVVATRNFLVVNRSGTPQTLNCTSGNKDHSRLEDGETQILAIDEPGRYTCASVEHPGAKATITVKDE